MRAVRFSERDLGELLEACAAQRRATLATLRSFDAAAWLRRGTVSGYPCSARAWAYIAAGHELHHIADFHERYGIKGPEQEGSALCVPARAEAGVSEGRIH